MEGTAPLGVDIGREEGEKDTVGRECTGLQGFLRGRGRECQSDLDHIKLGTAETAE